MTSRQPGPPPSASPGSAWLVRVLPLALLITLGMAGLRGAVAKPRWDGPWQRHGLVIGLVLEAVMGILLVITVRRRARLARAAVAGDPVSVAAKLRGVLVFGLSTGMIEVAVIIVIALHLRVFTVKPRNPYHPTPQTGPSRSAPPLTSQHPSTFHIPATALLYALLVVLLVAAIVLSIWWARRFRPPGQASGNDFIVEDPQDLREAVDAGRSALRTLDDARAAIIACYVAMEAHLAERGAARAVADTPDELLARAQATGLVRGTAAARLTALFYEARFSSHPLTRSDRDAAAEALDELAAALSPVQPTPAEPTPAPAEAGGNA